MLANGGLTLSFKDGVDEGELPGWGSLFGEDGVAAAVEAQILGLIADLGESGQAGSDVEIHVAQKGVLGYVEAYGDGGGVAVADFEIDVAHGRIEGAGVGVGDGLIGGHAAGARAGERDHHGQALRETGGIAGQYEYGPRCAVSEDAHSRPNVDRARQTIAAGGNEHNAGAGVFFRLVDSGLNGGAVVGGSVGVNAEGGRGEVHGFGVIEPGSDNGCGQN